MKNIRWAILTSLIITITSCYPSYDREVEDQDVVITLKHSNNFEDDEGQSKYTSYFLADTIMHLADSLKGELDPDFPRDFDEHILTEVKRQLDLLGYEQITSNLGDTPDLLISVSALAIKNTVVYSYYPGYWWGGGYWGAYWDDYWWGYPGYPGYPYWPTYPSYSVYTYNKGTVFIDMTSYDETQTKDEDVINNEWTGIVNGLLYEGNDPTEERLTYNINKLFEKSPYLQVK